MLQRRPSAAVEKRLADHEATLAQLREDKAALADELHDTANGSDKVEDVIEAVGELNRVMESGAAVAIRFSRTLKFGNTCRPSGTSPMPALATRNEGKLWIGWSSNTISPARIGKMPMTARTVVVLPMPLRPSRVTNSPAPISNDMPNNTWLSP